MYQTALLLLTGPVRLVVEVIGMYLNNVNKNVIKRLYVKLEPEFSKPFLKSDLKHLSYLSSAIPVVYSKASRICKHLDVRVLLTNMKNSNNESCPSLNFDVVLTNSDEEDRLISSYVSNNFNNISCNVIRLDKVSFPIVKEGSKEQLLSEFETYKTVCLGGTFDRLHNGHKVFLSNAALRAQEKLLVGVSDAEMVKKKVLHELIDPIEKRIEEVSRFLIEIDPSIRYEVFPISDPFGPTVTDPDINCIVVTTETKTGGEKVNIERKKRGMTDLTIIVIDVVENFGRNSHEEEKISSSTNRMHLLGTPLKLSQVVRNNKKPYCILFRGHFMSGKSVISNRFQSLRLPVLCCDEILRAIFHKDKDLHKNVAQKIGQNTNSNEMIDFDKLALYCLKNKEHKDWLADLVFSKMKSSLHQVLKVYSEQGARVVLIKDSAILEGYDLEIDVNEVWAAILPVNEATKKLKEFYNVSDDEVSKIISCLPLNEQYAETANILFCNMWSTDAIQAQVDRAWSYVNTIKDSILP